MSRKIYIAGSMAGYKDSNFEAFREHSIYVSFAGETPISPAEMDLLYEGWYRKPPKDFKPTHADRVRFIRRDLNAILDLDPATDGMFMLRGWEKSLGANVEYALAVFLGLVITIQEAD